MGSFLKFLGAVFVLMMLPLLLGAGWGATVEHDNSGLSLVLASGVIGLSLFALGHYLAGSSTLKKPSAGAQVAGGFLILLQMILVPTTAVLFLSATSELFQLFGHGTFRLTPFLYFSISLAGLLGSRYFRKKLYRSTSLDC